MKSFEMKEHAPCPPEPISKQPSKDTRFFNTKFYKRRIIGKYEDKAITIMNSNKAAVIISNTEDIFKPKKNKKYERTLLKQRSAFFTGNLLRNSRKSEESKGSCEAVGSFELSFEIKSQNESV